MFMSLVSNDSQLPVGLGMRLALDMDAMTNFVNLPAEKKQELVNYIESSTTGMEAKYRVTEVVRDLHDGGSFH
jgi:hypothetical protein